mgnify:CR=1 FL=1|tara:strand:- start:2355 stop:2603 length:249 start_codon:yes stop_codon:yes gene_type:complete
MTAERIKALEVQQANDSDKIDRLLAGQETQGRDIEEIKLSLGKQKGYIAGAMSVVVVIWTVILSVVTLLWDNIIDAITGALR